MPFTFAHPSILFPLKKFKPTWFDLTGLFFSSIAPDFEYFFRSEKLEYAGHSLFGLLWFVLPIGLLLSLLFHFLIRNSLIKNLPSPFDKNFNNFINYDFIKVLKTKKLVFTYSLIIGMCSHLLWDHFSHYPFGYFVRTFPDIFLAKPDLLFIKLPIYKLIQLGSSVLGLLVILIIFLRYNPSAKKPYLSLDLKSKLIFWSIFGFTFFISFVGFIIFYTKQLFLGEIIVIAIDSTFIGLIIAAISDNYMFRKT